MSHGSTPNDTGRVVLAYDGGITTSVAIPWLKRRGLDVVTVTLDLGQTGELATVRERALSLGAARAHVIDAREEFVRDFVEPALRAGLFGEGHLHRTVEIAYPLIARRLADLARMESASAVAFGGTRSALSGAVHALVAGAAVIALQQEDEFAFNDPDALARQFSIPIAVDQHVDATLWGRTVRLADGAEPEEAYTLTRASVDSPASPAVVDIDFVAGVPVRTNGVEMSVAEMIESLETIAGAHGVGRDLDAPGNLAVEAPAALVLQTALRALASAALETDLATMTARLSAVYADLLASGRWFSDVREAIDGFIDVLRPRLTGGVRVHLLRGSLTVLDVAVRPTANTPGSRAVA